MRNRKALGLIATIVVAVVGVIGALHIFGRTDDTSDQATRTETAQDTALADWRQEVRNWSVANNRNDQPVVTQVTSPLPATGSTIPIMFVIIIVVSAAGMHDMYSRRHTVSIRTS